MGVSLPRTAQSLLTGRTINPKYLHRFLKQTIFVQTLSQDRVCTKKLFFLFLNQNMLWILKRTVSMRQYF